VTGDWRPITELLDTVAEDLYTLDPADTTVALGTAWRGFCVAGAAGELLPICADRETYPPLWDNAQPVLSTAVHVLRAAPSLTTPISTEINPAGGPGDRLDDRAAAEVRRRILDLALALRCPKPLNAPAILLTGGHASRARCWPRSWAICYEGRLRSFLNPCRESFGPGSFVVRGQGRKNRARKRKRRRLPSGTGQPVRGADGPSIVLPPCLPLPRPRPRHRYPPGCMGESEIGRLVPCRGRSLQRRAAPACHGFRASGQ